MHQRHRWRLWQLSAVLALWLVALGARALDDPAKKESRQPQAAPSPARKGSTKKPRAEQSAVEAANIQSALALKKLWGPLPYELGAFDPRHQQIAVRGSLAVVATVDKLLVINAAAGQVVRELDLHAPRPVPPYGVLLDGDYALYATDNGYVAKLGLDGAYAFMTQVGARISAGPMLLDVDSDGTMDAVVVVAAAADADMSVRALHPNTGAELFGSRILRAQAGNKVSLVRDGANAFQLFNDGATYRFELSKDDGFEQFLPSPDSPVTEVSELVVAETAGPEFVYLRRTDRGVAFGSSLDSVALWGFTPTGIGPNGDVFDWMQVSTFSAEDVDGNGFWDLLAVRDGKLEAYSSGLAGKLYQRQPFEVRTPQHRFDEYRTPGASDNAYRFGTLAATSFDGFRESTAEHVEPLFATQGSHQAIAVHRRPLLRDAQRNSRSEYAHNGVQLFVRSSQGGFEIRPLSAEGEIRGLAVGEAHVVIAHDDKLVVCDAGVKECRVQPFDFSGHATGVVRGSSESRFWVATREGALVSYDVETRRFARALGVKPLAGIDRLLSVRDLVIASGARGTTVYAADGVSLREYASFQPALEQVVQCSSGGTYYARAGGELLEAASLRGPFELVQSQPSAIRALACDSYDALVVLSAASGALTLRGPMYFAWPEGLTAVMGCLAVLLFVVSLSYRRPKRGEQQLSAAAESVRLGIRPDLPLTSLPRNADSKLRGLVNALVRFIDNADTQPPITIGIYGPWGSGKSSAMRLVKHQLEAKRRYISVWFNPWRFHREKDIAAALLQSVVQEVRERAGLGRIVIALRRLARVPALIKLAWFVPLVGISAHALCFPHMYPRYLTLIGKELLSTELAGGSLLTITSVAGLVRFAQVARNVFKLNPADLLGEKNQEARVDFIRHFSDELAQVLDALPRAQQVVIFVDDLDRCPPDQTLEMLEALQLLTESQRCYFVLGMDQTMVRYAIELKYQSLLELKEKHGEDTTGFGAHYLEKIITLAAHVPLVRATDIEEELPTSSEQLAARERGESKLSPGGLLSFTQTFLVAWVVSCVLGFGYLFLTSTPARTTETSMNAAKDSAEPPGAPPPTQVAASVPQLAAAGEAGTAPEVRSAAELARNAREIPRERPPAAASPAAATSTKSADHAYRESRDMLLGLACASFVACVGLLAVAAVLYSRLRSIGPAGLPVKDSAEFNAALRVYLAHLPQNPRKLIRSGNTARFMYYLLGDIGRGCSPATFFASLLAEQYLRPIVGEASDAGELARKVMLRERTSGDEKDRIIQAWNLANVPKFTNIDPIDTAFCEELRSWLRGATTA